MIFDILVVYLLCIIAGRIENIEVEICDKIKEMKNENK